jgi:uncharacterized protein
MAEKVINGINIKKHVTVNDESKLVSIDISEDLTQAFITIEYDNMSHESKDTAQTEMLFTTAHIREILLNAGIVNGIIDENIGKCSRSKEIYEMPIAKATPAINDENDVVDIKFQNKREKAAIVENEVDKVDFRNLGAITAVKKGDVLAVLKVGRDGIDGVDIYGKPILKKKKKKIIIKAGDGAVQQDPTIVEAAIDGEPYEKNNTFYVYDVHTLNKDVSLETGDIIFIGDIKIQGNVREGMKVEAGNCALISGNTENCSISAKGDVTITGNSIMTTVVAGGKDAKIFKFIGILEETRDMLNNIMDTIAKIKKENMAAEKVADGDMIKLLMDTRFTELPKRCWGILRDSFDINSGNEDELTQVVREKLIGMAPLQIKHFGELDEIVNIINTKIESLGSNLVLPVNVKLGYCQDCNIQSSGDITIVGQGEYVSNMVADKSIHFVRDGSIARGGVLKANNEIVCKIVGSQGGVKTKLVVGRKGHIKVDLAYQNTIFSVGGREMVLDVPSTNIHAYMDENRELIVDRFKK